MWGGICLALLTLFCVSAYCYILVKIVIWKCNKEALQKPDKDVVDVQIDEL